jgi:hypothetical protein
MSSCQEEWKMRRLALIAVLCLLASAPLDATFELDDPANKIQDVNTKQAVEDVYRQIELIQFEKSDYLMLIVGNYVHGFKEFDTSVEAFDDSVFVGIYHDSNEQNELRAEQLADRFRKQLPLMLEKYDWAGDISILVSVYGEDRPK